MNNILKLYCLVVPLIAFVSHGRAMENEKQSTTDSETYLIAAVGALSRLIPLLESQEQQPVRISMINSMNTIAFIYWANCHSDMGSSKGTSHIDALIRAFYKDNRDDNSSLIEDPLVLTDEFFSLMDKEQERFLELRFGGVPLPASIIVNKDEYREHVNSFCKWALLDPSI